MAFRGTNGVLDGPKPRKLDRASVFSSGEVSLAKRTPAKFIEYV
jgi:hypothetical protein